MPYSLRDSLRAISAAALFASFLPSVPILPNNRVGPGVPNRHKGARSRRYPGARLRAIAGRGAVFRRLKGKASASR